MFIIDAINVLCAQLTRDLFAIAKFLFYYTNKVVNTWNSVGLPIFSYLFLHKTPAENGSEHFRAVFSQTSQIAKSMT